MKVVKCENEGNIQLALNRPYVIEIGFDLKTGVGRDDDSNDVSAFGEETSGEEAIVVDVEWL